MKKLNANVMGMEISSFVIEEGIRKSIIFKAQKIDRSVEILKFCMFI